MSAVLCAGEYGTYFGGIPCVGGSNTNKYVRLAGNRFQRNSVCICFLPRHRRELSQYKGFLRFPLCAKIPLNNAITIQIRSQQRDGQPPSHLLCCCIQHILNKYPHIPSLDHSPARESPRPPVFLLRCPIKSSGLRFSSILSTAATRSAPLLRHRRRSHRSPSCIIGEPDTSVSSKGQKNFVFFCGFYAYFRVKGRFLHTSTAVRLWCPAFSLPRTAASPADHGTLCTLAVSAAGSARARGPKLT